MKVGNVNGSYFKQAPKGANEAPVSFGWRLMTEIELGLTKEQRKTAVGLGVATDIVLVYSQLEQNELLLFHVEKNGLLNGLLDTTYKRDI